MIADMPCRAPPYHPVRCCHSGIPQRCSSPTCVHAQAMAQEEADAVAALMAAASGDMRSDAPPAAKEEDPGQGTLPALLQLPASSVMPAAC